MRFRCTQCTQSMDESLVKDSQMRLYKRKAIRLSDLSCPFCHGYTLEVEQ